MTFPLRVGAASSLAGITPPPELPALLEASGEVTKGSLREGAGSALARRLRENAVATFPAYSIKAAQSLPPRGRWIREVALDRTKPEGVPVALVDCPFVYWHLCCLFFLNPEKEAKRARGGVRLLPMDCHPLWTPPFAPILTLHGVDFAPIASRGRAIS